MAAMLILDFLDKTGIPIVIILLYILIFLSKDKIILFIKGKNNQLFLVNTEKFFDCFKFTIQKKYNQFLVPLISVVLLDLCIILITKTFFDPYQEPFWFLIVGRSILNPISEEILFRGLLFGVFFLTFIPSLIKTLFNLKLGFIYVFVILILQSLYFAWIHNDTSFITMLIRSSGGFLYGSLYIIYNKNLFPPTLAHFFHNLLIAIGYFNPNNY